MFDRCFKQLENNRITCLSIIWMLIRVITNKSIYLADIVYSFKIFQWAETEGPKEK